MRKIKKVGVIGAGVMGSGIAAHLANASIPCVMLDIVPPNLTKEEKQNKEARNRFALNGIQNIIKSKPAIIYLDKLTMTQGDSMTDNNTVSSSPFHIRYRIKEKQI